MRRTHILSILILLLLPPIGLCQTSSAVVSPSVLKIEIQGDSSRLPDLVLSLRRELTSVGIAVELVDSESGCDYNIVVAQESSLGGAASAVIALDRHGRFVASVVRSGRFTGKGAFNASAKELAKKLVELRPEHGS